MIIDDIVRKRGNRNSKNISAAYRGLHYSFIGRVDLTVCGNSDRLGRAA